MKHEKLANALNEVRDEYIEEAAKPKKKQVWPWASAVAAVLALAITVTSLAWPIGSDQAPEAMDTRPGSTVPAMSTETAGPVSRPIATFTAKSLAAGPVYPEMVPYPTDMENWELIDQWYEDQRAQYDQPRGYGDNLYSFYAESIPAFLDSDTGNKVYSPVNLYMALAMLAETAGGNTRQQILTALNADSMEALREQAGHMWNAHYCNDQATTLLLANSLWLDDTLPYEQQTANLLAEDYYASVFHGDLGSQEMNETLQGWLDANTGNFLQELTKNVEMDTRTLLALASTVYYKVKWGSEFNENRNTEDVFHAPSGDRTVTYMNSTLSYGPYFYGEDYSATSLRLEDGGRMWLILPDEGLTPQDILESGHALQELLVPGEPQHYASIIVNLQLPKFDISSQTDLVDGLQQIGLTDAFDPGSADFSGISSEQLFVSQASHGARVKIDEKGLEAASYVVMMDAGAGMPPEEDVDFVLDRPFLFVVESDSGMPLFTGVVNEP